MIFNYRFLFFSFVFKKNTAYLQIYNFLWHYIFLINTINLDILMYTIKILFKQKLLFSYILDYMLDQYYIIKFET